MDAGETDLAIEVFEKSIEEYKMPGKAQQQLVKLYNAKRREAAMSRDGAAAKAYLDKVNAIMDLSKNAIRGRN